ncbi:MAG: hypothetical protein ACLTG4_09885 [Oscillospiraceae bacterium]
MAKFCDLTNLRYPRQDTGGLQAVHPARDVAGGRLCREWQFAKTLFKVALNQSSAADAGSFPPIHRFGKLDVHKVRLHFPNLDSTKNSSPSALEN